MALLDEWKVPEPKPQMYLFARVKRLRRGRSEFAHDERLLSRQ